MAKITINNEKCIGCGACLQCEEVFEEISGGKVKVRGGGIVDGKELSIVKEIVDLCPEKAILLIKKRLLMN